MKELTSKQLNVLRFIYDFSKENHYPPSIREIVRHLGVKSTNGVNDHLVALARKQCITRCREKQTSRSVVITALGMEKLGIVADDSHSRPALRIPLVKGWNAEGDLLDSANVEDVVSVDSGLFPEIPVPGAPPVTRFAIRFHGDNMVGAGIRNDDILLARRQDAANSGDLAVLALAGDMVVRRYFPEGERVRLQTVGETTASSYANMADIRVLGVVTGLIRKSILL